MVLSKSCHFGGMSVKRVVYGEGLRLGNCYGFRRMAVERIVWRDSRNAEVRHSCDMAVKRIVWRYSRNA